MKRTIKLGKSGFTLMELLLVISIIALLAAILMPALGNARELAKAAECMSNQKNVGSQINLYCADNRSMFPTCYHYADGVGQSGAGYVHWTAIIAPNLYPVTFGVAADGNVIPKFENQYICPSHAPGGFAPTDFTSTRIANPPPGQITEKAFDDYQAPRLSYVVNEIIMPRKKFSATADANNFKIGGGTDANFLTTTNLCLVSQDEVDGPCNTILAAEFSNNPAGILGKSASGGTGFKSHRPTNAISTNASGTGGTFNSENSILPGTPYYQLAYSAANAELNALNENSNVYTADTTDDHIIYINPATHKTGSNYVFADGHAAKYSFADTFGDTNTGTNAYMWGHKVYSIVDKPLIQVHN